MKIKIKENNVFTEEFCIICMETFEANYIIAYGFLVDENGEHKLGLVCDKCVVGGVKKIRWKLLERAEWLRRGAELDRQKADYFTDLAISKAIQCPTKAEWKKTLRVVKDAVEKAMGKDITPARWRDYPRKNRIASFEGERNKGRLRP